MSSLLRAEGESQTARGGRPWLKHSKQKVGAKLIRVSLHIQYSLRAEERNVSEG
jgi:hypothetical protein